MSSDLGNDRKPFGLQPLRVTSRQAPASAGGGESVLPFEDRRQPIHQIVIGFVLGFPKNTHFTSPYRLTSGAGENYPMGTCYLDPM